MKGIADFQFPIADFICPGYESVCNGYAGHAASPDC